MSWRYAIIDPFAGGAAFSLYISPGLAMAGGADATDHKTVLTSADGGKTWAAVTVDPFGIGVASAVAVSSGRLLAASGGTPGVRYSDDAGGTWHTPVYDPFAGGVTNALAVLGAGRLLAGGTPATISPVQTDGVASSADNGTTWADAGFPFPAGGGGEGQGFDFSVGGSGAHQFIAAIGLDGTHTHTHVCYTSPDGGASWFPTTNPYPALSAVRARVLVIPWPAATPQPWRILVTQGTASSTPIKYSDDNGATWHASTFDFPTSTASPLATGDGISAGAVIAGVDLTSDRPGQPTQIAVSGNGGATWSLQSSQPFAAGAVQCLAGNGRTVLVGGGTPDGLHALAWWQPIAPPTRQTPRDDPLALGGTRQTAISSGPTSRQYSYRQGTASTYS